MARDTLEPVIKRLDRLERAVFGGGGTPPKKPIPVTAKTFAGAKGGVNFLTSKGFFRKKRTAPEVKKELENHDYFYRIQVIQTALNRLSGRNGPLASYKEKGKKVYVNRR